MTDFEGSALLRNAVAVVTGATSGMGRATALACARAGADVVIGGRNADAASDVAAEIAAMGRETRTVLGDIADSAYCEELIGCTLPECTIYVCRGGNGFIYQDHICR